MGFLMRMEALFFEILFVMTEVVGKPGSWALQKTMFLFWIDLGQVLRVMTMPAYGWSESTYDTFKNIDLVYVFANLVSRVVPRYSLFVLGSFLVLLALADTAYALKVFKRAAKIQTMWPIKLLRMLVATVVTILFSSVLKWLLIPIECEVSRERSLSSYLHGEDAPCTPWILPEVLFSMFTIVICALYITFALVVSLLSFEINPLARGVRSQCTGRVEVFWIVSKVAVTFLAYLARWVMPVTCGVVFLLMMLLVLYKHLQLLPFHRHETNVIRGGVFTCCCWLALATTIVAAAEGSLTSSQEWWLLGFIPVFFLLGASGTHYMRNRITHSIERLRAEFVFQSQLREEKDKQEGWQRTSSFKEVKAAQNNPAWQRFYDPTWESRKAFRSEAKARLVMRTLLYRRDRNDVPFLVHLMQRALEEYPDSVNLRIFELLLVRFIKQDQIEAQALERRYKLDQKSLPIDYRYIFFALERKAVKDSAGASLGKETFSVINVMEFDAGMERAKKAHMQCIVALRKFWQVAGLLGKKDREEVMVSEMLGHMKTLDTVIDSANQEYMALVELYPSSVTLLQTYAHFCDTILSDEKEAEKWRTKADALEDYDEDESSMADNGEMLAGGAGGDAQKKQGSTEKFKLEDGRSETSGVSSMRSLTNKSLTSWRETVLNDEQRQVNTLHSRVKLVVFVLLCVAGAGYAVMNHYLLSDLAFQNINSIDSTLYFAHHTVLTCFLLRDQQIAAIRGDSSRVEHDREIVTRYMKELKHTHRINFESLTSQGLREFYTEYPWIVHEPTMAGWIKKSHHFWYQLNDFARRVLRAVSIAPEEIMDPIFRLDEISDEKRNVAFVYENTFPVLMPAYEELLHLYQEEVKKFVALSNWLIAITACANAFFILGVTCFVQFTLRRVVPKMQSSRVNITTALRFPKKVRQKLKELYTQLEHLMVELADEEAARNALEKEEETEGDRSPALMMPVPSGDDMPTPELMPRPEPIPERVRPISAIEGGGVGRWDDVRAGPTLNRVSSTRSVALTASNLMEFTRMQSHDGQAPPPPAKWNLHSGSFNRSIRSLLSQDQLSLQPQARAELTRRNSITDLDGDGGPPSANRLRKRRASLSSVRSWMTEDTPEGTSAPRLGTPRLGPNSPLPADDSSIARVLSAGPRPNAVKPNSWVGMSPVLAPRPFKPDAEAGGISPPGAAGAAGLPPLDRIDSVSTSGESTGDGKGEDGAEVLRLYIHRDLATVAEVSETSSPAPTLPRRSLTNHNSAPRPESDMDLAPTAEARSEPGEVVVDVWSNSEDLRAGSDADVALQSVQLSETVFVGSRPRGPDVVVIRDVVGIAKEEEGMGEGCAAAGGGRLDESATEHSDDIGRSEDRGGVRTDGTETERVADAEGTESEMSRPAPVQPQDTGKFSLSSHHSHVHFGEVRDIDKTGFPATEVDGNGNSKEHHSPKSVLRHSQELDRPGQGVARGKIDSDILRTSARRTSFKDDGHQPFEEPPLPPVDDEGMMPNELDDTLMEVLDGKVHASRRWHSLGVTWILATLALIGLCIFSIVYPMRILPDIADMAPMVDHGGRRAYLVQSVVFLARELVISDGFSRVHQYDNARQLEMLLHNLEREHEAVRLGGDRDIRIGADLRFESHNTVMYEPGCPWRSWEYKGNSGGHRRATASTTNEGDECYLESRRDAAANGLNHLMLTFFDSVRSIIFKFKPEDFEISTKEELHAVVEEDTIQDTTQSSGDAGASSAETEDDEKDIWYHEFSQTDFLVVNTSTERLDMVNEDPDMKFLIHNLEGDLVIGLNMLQELFHDEAHKIIDNAHIENEILFILYALAIVIGWYFTLFRSVVKTANDEARKAHNFILRLPLHVLTTKEINVLHVMFLEPEREDKE